VCTVIGLGIFVYVTRLALNDLSVTQRLSSALIGYPLISIACCLLLLAAIGVKFAIPKSLIYLGKISYGLYVLHMLAMFIVSRLFQGLPHGSTRAAVQIILIFGVTVALAALSYQFLERPFLKLKDRFTRVASRPV